MNIHDASVLINQFENCLLPKEEWTHESHFVMAYWYCYHLPLPRAIHAIREGIKKYNLSVGGVNSGSEGYHETITLFYVKLIIQYLQHADPAAGLDKTLASLLRQPFLEKNFPLRYYSRDLLMSKTARTTWVAPDLQPL